MRLLRKDEIELRAQTVNEKGLSLLLYKDARVDMSVLDEEFGPMNWQRKHEFIDGYYFCTVSVKHPETGEWISRQDVGTKSNADPEKGAASDSFKRACTNFGIGRELYTSPFVWISAKDAKITERNGKYACYDKFKVSDITYDDNRCISGLVIVNQSGAEVYRYPSYQKRNNSSQKAAQRPAESQDDKIMEAVSDIVDLVGDEEAANYAFKQIANLKHTATSKEKAWAMLCERAKELNLRYSKDRGFERIA